ncbi:MAG: hypothetical protein WC641_03355 [Patescibacteria group bacterium]
MGQNHKAASSRLLTDRFTGEKIIVAPGRSRRPEDIKRKVKDIFSPDEIVRREDTQAVFGRGKFKVTAIKNLYPVFNGAGYLYGRQEILVEGSRSLPFWDFSAEQMAVCLEAIAARIKSLRRDGKIKYSVAFKNEGERAGASQPHPHTQLYGMSFVPDRIKLALKNRRRALGVANPKGNYLLKEAAPELIVYRDKFVTAFAPPISRFGHEICLTTNRRLDSITDATPHELKALAKGLKSLMPFMKKRKLAFNFFTHDIPGRRDECFELRFTPRRNIFGGYELDNGVFINPVSAEQAAREYRAAL